MINVRIYITLTLGWKRHCIININLEVSLFFILSVISLIVIFDKGDDDDFGVSDCDDGDEDDELSWQRIC